MKILQIILIILLTKKIIKAIFYNEKFTIADMFIGSMFLILLIGTSQ
jgi:hypothetical protein